MKIITIQCNKCGTKSIYIADRPESKELKCKGCKSDDIKIIKNPGEQLVKKLAIKCQLIGYQQPPAAQKQNCAKT